jgi:hypothetical protein
LRANNFYGLKTRVYDQLCNINCIYVKIFDIFTRVPGVASAAGTFPPPGWHDATWIRRLCRHAIVFSAQKLAFIQNKFD